MNLRTEAIAGITTFFTVAYIVVVNPSILSQAGIAFSAVLTATVLLAFSMTLFMGLYGKLPFAVAPGMGINAFFTFTLVLGQGIPWPTALGMVFWSGILFIVVSVTPLREQVARAIPPNLRSAAAVGCAAGAAPEFVAAGAPHAASSAAATKMKRNLRSICILHYENSGFRSQKLATTCCSSDF